MFDFQFDRPLRNKKIKSLSSFVQVNDSWLDDFRFVSIRQSTREWSSQYNNSNGVCVWNQTRQLFHMTGGLAEIGQIEAAVMCEYIM
jgi:hypothetical protein